MRRAEVLAAKRMVERAMNSFNLYPARLLGDSAYGSAEMLGWLVYEHGIEPHVTVFDKSSRKDGTFSREDFHYDHERDVYLCPGGKMLTTTGTRVNDDATLLYRASKANCEGCSLKPRCCPKDVARKVPRSVHEGARDMARAIAKSGRKRRHGARSAQGIRGRMGQAISSDWPGLASGLGARTRGSFPNDDAALKLLYLAIKNAGMRWRRGIEWTAAMGQFAIQFGERFLGTAR